jgi:hypothetical protein
MPAFAPSTVGVIERIDDPTATRPGMFVLVGGAEAVLTPATRSLFESGHKRGDLLATGTDGIGPWLLVAEHQVGSSPDCFLANGIVFDDGDPIVFAGFRFQKGPGFESFQSTTPGHRYLTGDPCFDKHFEVIRVGHP